MLPCCRLPLNYTWGADNPEIIETDYPRESTLGKNHPSWILKFLPAIDLLLFPHDLPTSDDSLPIALYLLLFVLKHETEIGIHRIKGIPYAFSVPSSGRTRAAVSIRAFGDSATRRYPLSAIGRRHDCTGVLSSN